MKVIILLLLLLTNALEARRSTSSLPRIQRQNEALFEEKEKSESSSLNDITEEKKPINGQKQNEDTLYDETIPTPPAPINASFNAPAPQVPDIGSLFSQSIKKSDAMLLNNDTNTITVTQGDSAIAQERNDTPLFKDPDLFQQEDEKKSIYLNFENAELKNFIEYIADIKNMNIIPDKTVAGVKISLNFRNPVSVTGAWNTFLTVLEMANFSIVKYKNGVTRDNKDQYIYRIIPKDKKLQQPLPTFIGIDPDQLPDSDATIRYVAFLNNTSIQEVQPLLQSMLGQPSSLILQPNVNGLIITDRSYNIKSAMKVIQELDHTGLHEEVMVIQLKRANAIDVKNLFDSLMSKKTDANPLARLLGKQGEDSTDFFAPSTKIIAEERTNSLILLGTKESLEKVRNFIVDHVDTDLRQTESPLRIYELQYTQATEIADILREVTSAQNYQSQIGQQAAKYGAIRGGVKYFKPMTFQADVEGNRLLVSCTDNKDWELLKTTIKELDVPQPQVAINMLIVTVSANSLRQLGGQMRNKTYDTIGKNIGFQSHPINNTIYETNSSNTPISLLGNLLNAFTPVQGSSVLTFGKAVAGENGLWAIFRALSTETDASVIAEPFITVANRTSSTLVVGESKYVITQEAVGASGSSSQGRSQENANTEITLTPQINLDGIIKLDINASIDEFIAGTDGNAKQTKKLKTNVTLANGQVLALGGFVKTKITEKGGETPLLGRIPILGWLAKNKDRAVEKSYVFFFICPTIIKPRQEPGMNTYTKIQLHSAAKEVEEAIQTTRSNDPIHNWFFNSSKENYSHKVIDFANARYQPNSFDVRYNQSESTTLPDKKQSDTNIKEVAPTQRWLEQEGIPPAPQAEFDGSRRASEPETITLPTSPEIIRPAAQESTPERATLKEKLIPTQTPISELKTQASRNDDQIEDIVPTSGDVLDQKIEENRSKLRNLLAGKSLIDLLSKAPTEDIPLATPEQEQMIREEDSRKTTLESIEKRPHEYDSVPLARRQGIKNLLATPEAEEQHSSHNQRGNQTRSLRSLLGT